MPVQNRRSRKWVYGSNTVISTVIFFGILVVLVLIAARHPLRVDLTESKSFSLSGQTQNILKSLEQPVSIKCFFSNAAPDQEQMKSKTKDLLDSYRYASQKITYEFIDPDSHPEVAKSYDIKNYGTLVLEGFGKKQFVQTATEENITNAILKLTSKEQKKIYFLTGHGEHSATTPGKESYTQAGAAMDKENYAISEFNLLERKDVPEDAAVVIIAGPKKPIPDAEQKVLSGYLARGGRVLLMLDPLVDTGMDRFVKDYGIELSRDVIVDRLSRLFGGSERVPVVVEYGRHKITQGFNLPTFYPDARSVVPAQNPPKGVHVQVLAATSQNAWAERNIDVLNNKGEAAFDKGEDLAGPVPVVVLATIGRDDPQGAAKPDKKPEKEGTLVVVGNSEYASNTYFNLYGNGDFFLNTISFLADEGNLITVSGRPNVNRPMLLTRQQAAALFWVVLVLVPLAVLVSGLAVYKVRRARR